MNAADFVPLIKGGLWLYPSSFGHGGYADPDTIEYKTSVTNNANANANAHPDEKKANHMNTAGGIEHFISSNQTTSIVGSIFTVMATMIFAGIIAVLFFWAYGRDVNLFITILAGIVFIYAGSVTIYFGVSSNTINSIAFQYFMGSSVFMSLCMLILIVYFMLKIRSGGGGSGQSQGQGQGQFRY